MLEEQRRGFACSNWEVLLNFISLASPKWRICEDYFVTVLVLDICETLRKCVGMGDVRRFDAVENHVHDRDDIRE